MNKEEIKSKIDIDKLNKKKLDLDKLTLMVAHIFENILAMAVLLAVFLGTLDILRTILRAYVIDFYNPVEYGQLSDMLGQILLLVIGVELVVMLSLHIPGTLVEVLLYAIARKMLLLPKEGGMVEVLLGAFAIAVLFAIRKYLLSDDPIRKYLLNGDKDRRKEKNKPLNGTEEIEVTEVVVKEDATLGDFIIKYLLNRKKLKATNINGSDTEEIKDTETVVKECKTNTNTH